MSEEEVSQRPRHQCDVLELERGAGLGEPIEQARRKAIGANVLLSACLPHAHAQRERDDREDIRCNGEKCHDARA